MLPLRYVILCTPTSNEIKTNCIEDKLSLYFFSSIRSKHTFYSACRVVHIWQFPDTQGSILELSGRRWTCPAGWVQSKMGQEHGGRSTFTLVLECRSRSRVTRGLFSLFGASVGRKCHSLELIQRICNFPKTFQIDLLSTILHFVLNLFSILAFPNVHFGKQSVVILSTLQPCRQSSAETTFALGTCQIAAIPPPLTEMFWTPDKKVSMQ